MVLAVSLDKCNGLDVELNRTSSVPMSVHPYELDKDSSSIWKLPLYGMDVHTLSSFLRPTLSVFFSKTGETGDINTIND